MASSSSSGGYPANKRHVVARRVWQEIDEIDLAFARDQFPLSHVEAQLFLIDVLESYRLKKSSRQSRG